MAVYNDQRHVERSLCSVLDDPYPDLEVLVFDNGSTDATCEILHRLAEDDPRLRIERSERRLGLGKAKAKMVGLTDAEYIIPFDTSCVFLPGRTVRQLAALDRNPDVAGVYGKAKKLKSDRKEFGLTIGHSFSSFNLPAVNPIPLGAAMLRRAAILEAGNYIEIGSDLEEYSLLLRITQCWQLLFENEFRNFIAPHDRHTPTDAKEKGEARAIVLHRQMLDANKHLVAELCSGDTLSFSQSDIPRIMLVLGLLCMKAPPPPSPEHLSVLKVAERIEPDDYGVIIQKHLRLAAMADVSGALHQCDILRARFPHDNYLCLLACDYTADLLRHIADAPREKIAQSAALHDKFDHSYHHGPVAIDR